MSLKDKDIDKMYSASAERLSFEYKESYWDEFESQLSNTEEGTTQKESLSDSELDAVFTAGAAGLSFDYKKEYWDEFNTMQSEAASADTTKSRLTDTEIDAMYAASAAGLSFDYNNNYWTDFNESFTGDAVLSDSGIDEMYQESANDLSFEYQPSYWEEFKGRIRRRRRPDFLWFATAYSFVGVIGVMMFMNGSSESISDKAIADTPTTENYQINKITAEVENESFNGKIENINDSSINEGVLVENKDLERKLNLTVNSNTNEVDPTTEVSDEVAEVIENNDLNHKGTPTEELAVIDESEDDQLDGENRNETLEVQPVYGENIESNQTESEPIAILSSEELLDEERIELAYRDMDLDEVQIENALIPAHPLNLPKRASIVGYVQGIGGLSQSLVTPSDEHSYSFGLGIGTTVNRGNLSFRFGINGLVENHNDLVLNRTAKVYGFGSDVYKFNIDYKQMYTLEGTFGVGYNIGRNRFELGVRPSYVIGSRVRIEEIGSSTTVFSSENDYNESRDVFGFMDGIHRLGIKPMFGYSFMLLPTMSIGANIGIELMPSINEDYINGVNNKLPIDGQLYLRKSLSFRKRAGYQKK